MKTELERVWNECQRYRSLLVDSQQSRNQLQEEFDHVVSQRNKLQDEKITWSLCPECGRVVPMRGIPCLIGNCKCGYIVMESEMIAVNIDEILAEWYQLRTQKPEAAK